MRPADLPPVQQLATNKPHGHKMRYMAGCRCWRCRAGNAAYERQLNEKRRLFGPNDLVSTDRVRQHLRYLQQFGMGHKTVAKHALTGKTVLAEILWYSKKQMRRRNEARVLAVQPTLDTLPRNVRIPATETVAKIRQLVLWGYPKALINRDGLGLHTGGMQIHALRGRTATVSVKTAVKVRDFFAKIEAIRHRWEEWHGPIPRDHFVYGKRSKRGWETKHLELRPVSRAYKYYYIYPPDLKAAINLANQLTRACRKRTRNEEHHGRSTQSSIRHH
jgi:hypothetical protein